MFQEWGFLISEMFVLIVLAALLGLLVGWIVWGRRGGDVTVSAGLQADLEKCRADAKACQSDLASCKAASADKDKRIAELERDVEKAEELVEAAEVAAMEAAGEAVAVAEAVEADHGAHPVHPVVAPVEPAPEPTPEPESEAKDYDGDGVIEGTDEGVKPATLTAARDGQPDDLKQIKGIGPKLEQLCNSLGFFHFDQIAAWTEAEVAWADENLVGFKGRVSRDDWVAQARKLAAGEETEFSRRAKDDGIYD